MSPYVYTGSQAVQVMYACKSGIISNQYTVLTPKDVAKGRAPMAVPGNFAVIWVITKKHHFVYQYFQIHKMLKRSLCTTKPSYIPIFMSSEIFLIQPNQNLFKSHIMNYILFFLKDSLLKDNFTIQYFGRQRYQQ